MTSPHRVCTLRRRLAMALSVLAMATGAAGTAQAQEVTSIKFMLDWKLQGIHAWYYLAEDRGYFAKEKLAVTIDQGDGSSAAVMRVMSGVYQAGFGDVNAIVQAAAAKPGLAPVMVYMIYNRAPFALITKADGPVRTLKDTEGRNIGTTAGGAAARMFPILAEKSGVDATKVHWTNLNASLQEQLLLKGQVDASAVFSVTSYMNLIAQGVDPDKDIRWFPYADHGIDLYGNGVLVSQQMRKDKPEAVAGLVRAINHAVRDTIADPDAAMAALSKREPLLNKDLEKRRLLYTLRTVMLTPEVQARGLGDVVDERLTRSIAQQKTAFELTRLPAAGEVFDRRFLPPLAERRLLDK